MNSHPGQKEIGTIKLSDSQGLVGSLINSEKVDLRAFIKTDSHTGATKRGFIFYHFDNNWIKFKKLIDKIDKAYNEMD